MLTDVAAARAKVGANGREERADGTMNPMSRASILVFAFTALLSAQQNQRGTGAPAQAPGRTSTIEERTSGMQKLDGYFPVYWDDRTGNLWLEIPRLDADFLYATGLAAGLGSNDIGLDR